jgi:hypothetical protein
MSSSVWAESWGRGSLVVLLERAGERVAGRPPRAHGGGARRPFTWSAQRRGSPAVLLELAEEGPTGRPPRARGGATGLVAGTGFSEKGDGIRIAIHRLEKVGTRGSAFLRTS